MGSSSKKTKGSKESRKRRHRSRSNSEESSREREKDKQHRHRRHHKERRHDKQPRHKDYDSEGSDVQPPSPQPPRDETPPPSQNKGDSPSNNQSVDSLSIEETNKLRAKLGLKPLELHSSKEAPDSSKGKDSKLKDDLGEFYHKPASNLAEKTKQEKIRTKLSERKEKRNIESKLSKVRTLGESDSEDDTESWVQKNRRIQMEKEQAAKRAKMLEELDEEFGVSDIVESETRLKKAKVYSDKHLKGLKVEHNISNFSEGKSVILTLKDQDVLAEDGDVLVNVNMIDDERYEKSNEIKKKKPGYQAFDDDEFDEFGNPKEKSLLSKYDEEIDGVKKSAFVIGESSSAAIKKSLALSVKEKLSNKRLESLVLPELNIASEYYTEEEMTKFRKPKKKVKKLRSKGKVLTAAELAAQVEGEAMRDHGSRKRRGTEAKVEENGSGPSKGEFTDWMDIDDLPEVQPILSSVKVEQDDSTLQRALHKARRLKQRDALTTLPAVTELIKEEPASEESIAAAEAGGSIILNSTAEFCRTLGDIPTYGKAGNRDEDEDLIDFDRDLKQSPSSSPQHAATSGSWNPVDPMEVGETTVAPPEAPILDEEPDVGSGVGAALKLAMSKGYLDKEENNRPSNSKFAHLQARHYSIEDKTYGDDDKFGGRRERYQGPTQDFKEKDMFRPNVKLEYIDDDGRVLNPKEAFRYLSHKFHGKGPGKNKIEKRIKKSEQEGLMKKMSSTDTPLGTLNMLQHKQKEMQSPYIVLSGSKHTHSTSISKAARR